jgi:hypothetical protein
LVPDAAEPKVPGAGQHVLVLVHDLEIRVIITTDGELLRDLTLDPTRDYQHQA